MSEEKSPILYVDLSLATKHLSDLMGIAQGMCNNTTITLEGFINILEKAGSSIGLNLSFCSLPLCRQKSRALRTEPVVYRLPNGIDDKKLSGAMHEWYEGYKEGKMSHYKVNFPALTEVKNYKAKSRNNALSSLLLKFQNESEKLGDLSMIKEEATISSYSVNKYSIIIINSLICEAKYGRKTIRSKKSN